jgi:hypothetical protein
MSAYLYLPLREAEHLALLRVEFLFTGGENEFVAAFLAY